MTKNVQTTFFLPSIYVRIQKNMLLLLRYSSFKNFKFWLVKKFFDYAQLKSNQPPFTFSESKSQVHSSILAWV